MDQQADMTAMALRELDVIATIVDDIAPPDYDRPSTLPGWTVEELVRHIVTVAFRQAEAFHRARLTITDAPADATVTAPSQRLAAMLRSALAHATSGTSSLDPSSDPVVPLPYASVPASVAGFILLVEYGIHRYDVEEAMTGAGRLADDTAEALVDRLDLVLPALASSDEPPMKTIRLEPDGRSATMLVWGSGGWGRSTDGEEPDCVVSGPADALVLFVTGRVAPADDRLITQDPAGALRHFKAVFPGP